MPEFDYIHTSNPHWKNKAAMGIAGVITAVAISGCKDKNPTPVAHTVTTNPMATQTVRPTETPLPVVTSTLELAYTPEERKRKEALEQKYDITLSISAARPGGPQKPWSISQMNMMDDFLGNLPESLYGPDESGRKLQIELTFNTDACCGITNGKSEVSLGSFGFDPEHNRIGAARSIAHELTHRQEDLYLPTQNSRVLSTKGQEGIEKALGGKFNTIRTDLKKVSDAKKLEIPKNSQEFSFLFGSFDPNIREIWEFAAELAGNYVMGKEYFIKMYGLVLPQEIVESLYNHTKDEVFKGKEYQTPLPNLKK